MPVVTKEISSRKKMGGCTARLFVQNFDAVLIVIVISAGDAIFAKFNPPPCPLDTSGMSLMPWSLPSAICEFCYSQGTGNKVGN